MDEYDISTSLVMTFNEQVRKMVQDVINSFVSEAVENGGKVWLTSKDDKEFKVVLPQNLEVNFILPITED